MGNMGDNGIKLYPRMWREESTFLPLRSEEPSSGSSLIAQLETVLKHTQRKSQHCLNGICEPRTDQKQNKQSVSQKRDNASFGEKLG